MRVLIVGAGSVGQVYGWHLERGGADVHVFVREKYADEARAGFVLYPPGQKAPVRWTPRGVVTSADAVRAQAWDQVWLCIPSPALRGPWLAELVAAMGSATLVSMLPGLRDRELLDSLVPPERLVLGLISFSSWHAPLTDEALPEPGMAWWHPPLTPNLYEGPKAAVDAIVSTLRAGGCPAARGAATATAARGSSFLVNVVAAMECAGWTFAGLRGGPWADLAAGAASEALTISSAHLGVARGPLGLLMSPIVVRLATRLAPWIAPMDFEAFLRVHFSKVGAQTSMAIDTWIDDGRTRGLPVASLESLAKALQAARA
jgi:2-dehydropantoate 2-reductase